MAERLFDTDIPWTSRPLPTPATAADVSTPDERGLLYAEIVTLEARVQSLEQDVATYRALISTALDTLASLTTTVVKQSGRLATQTEQLRTFFGRVD